MRRAVHVYDTSRPLIPYVSQTRGCDDWRCAAEDKWDDLELPHPEPPPDNAERCFVRWGDMPDGGRSFNHQLQEREPGVAVFRAYKQGARDYLVDLERSVTLAILFVRLSTSGYRFYEAYGTPCGTGGGG